MSHFAFHMSHVICEMLMLILGTCWTTFVFMSMLKSVKLSGCQVVKLPGCQDWSMGHAEQLLFSCLCLKVSSCQVVKFDPWDMLNNFCFHVYAQKLLFLCEICNGFHHHRAYCTPTGIELVHRAGSQLKNKFSVKGGGFRPPGLSWVKKYFW